MVYCMKTMELKLKQASAVLGIAPKDLQNLVQFKVLRPTRRDSFYWFDNRLLLEAKVALYLKESLGTSTEVLALFARALSGLKDEEVARLRYVSLRSLPTRGREPIEIRVPLRELAKELDEQLPRAAMYQDLPRGRKRPGWKREFTRSLAAAAQDLSGVTESQIEEAIRGFRAEKKRLPEITVGPSRKTA
jgi:phosphoserine phosphatase